MLLTILKRGWEPSHEECRNLRTMVPLLNLTLTLDTSYSRSSIQNITRKKYFYDAIRNENITRSKDRIQNLIKGKQPTNVKQTIFTIFVHHVI